MTGVLEIVAIVMSLNGFGVDANPKAATPAQITKYEVGDADVRVYVDLEAVVPRNFKAFEALPNQKAIKANPKALKMIEGFIKNANAGRMFAKGMIGMDPIKDIKSVAAWIKAGSGPMPTGVVAIRGNFPLNLLTRVAGMAQQSVTKINGHPTVTAPGNQALVAFVKADSVLLVGTPALVKARLSKKWRRARAKRGSASARFAGLLRQKPFFAVASSLSAAASSHLQKMLPKGPDKFLGQVLTEHKYAAIAAFHNGIGWSWVDKGSLDGYKRAVMASEGILALFRSMHFGARGLAKVVLSVVDSYASVPQVAMIAKHKKDILAMVNGLTGSGKFKVTWKKNPRTKSMEVRATGKSLSSVIPMAGLVPLMAAAWLTQGKDEARAPKSAVSSRAVMKTAAASGLQIKSTYRRVKAEKLKVNRKLR